MAIQSQPSRRLKSWPALLRFRCISCSTTARQRHPFADSNTRRMVKSGEARERTPIILRSCAAYFQNLMKKTRSFSCKSLRKFQDKYADDAADYLNPRIIESNLAASSLYVIFGPIERFRTTLDCSSVAASNGSLPVSSSRFSVQRSLNLRTFS